MKPADRVRSDLPSAFRLSALVAVASLLAACGGGGSPSSMPASASPSAAVPFNLGVVPGASVGRTVGGQKVVFLVTASGAVTDGAVEIAATAPNATVSVEPQPLPPGVVGEVTVVPQAVQTADEVPLEVTISASRGGITREERRTLTMVAGEDSLATEAKAQLAPFIAWLATERPDLGITAQTSWEGSVGSWVLIVSHYQYLSDDWELGLSWHVMVPPDDWARIYLRHRWTEAKPSLAFEISSVAGATQPHAIDPPEAVWR
jgi:hypothetical protein